MAIVLQLSGKSLQVGESAMPLIQQRPPNRKSARNYNQIGGLSGERGCFQGGISEAFLNSGLKRREANSKGEKERYKHLNAEFQRIAR